jgi:hypothetical protein
MKHRWALVAMGAWLMGTICMSIVATENFYTIDRLLADRANPAFASAVERLGSPAGRDLLRYLSSELNRLYFQMWNIAQLVLGALALWLIARSGTQSLNRAALGVISMLAIVVVMLVYMTPAIVSLGRSLDFVPRDPAPPGMRRFWILHASYTTLEMFKLLLGAVVIFWLVKEPSSHADNRTRAPERTSLDPRALERALEVDRLEP